MKNLGSLTMLLLLAICFQWIGGKMNEKAMYDNNGKMPVLCFNDWMQNFTTDARHAPYTEKSKDLLLSDIFLMPEFTMTGIDLSMVSLGDAFIGLGMGLYCLAPFIVLFMAIRSCIKR
ncbi:MAG: DUF5317 family protein [Patescibacteria group bacterium]|nr:DUF5317 family protein [Patescibacteria group bacterium]